MNNHIPKMLPLNKKIKAEEYINELVEAYGSIKEYQTIFKYTKTDKDILLHLIYTKEAVESINLVEHRASLEEYFELSNEKNRNHVYICEIENYIETLKKSKEFLKNTDFGSRLFNKIHLYLMEGYREKVDIGNFRNRSNPIISKGCLTEPDFTPPPAHLVKGLMDNLVDYLNNDNEYHLLIKTAIIQAQFESIHPFEDGNGRMGRILLPLYSYNYGLIDNPNLFISEVIGKDICAYYRNLDIIRQNNDWLPWIKYFLNSITEQTKSLIKFIISLEELYLKNYNEIEKRLEDKYIRAIYKSIFKNPIFTINYLVGDTGYNYQTIRKYLVVLESDGIIRYSENNKGRIYYYDELLKILKRPGI